MKTDETADADCSLPGAATNAPLVSVIIPVYNDAARLRLCLERLARQSYPGDRYEVLVVDNGSSDDVRSPLVACPQARLLFEDTPGAYAARNTAITQARGEVIAFTDADCLPEEDWLAQGVACLAGAEHCGLVAGRIELFCADETAPTAVELYETIRAFDQERYANEEHFGATANVLTWRRVLDQVGGFDQTCMSGSDKEWGERVFSAGYRVVYGAQVRVRHPARRTYRELFRKVSRDTWPRGDERTRIKTVVGEYVRTLMPPWSDLALAAKDRRLAGIKNKLRFMGVVIFVRWVRLYEVTRQLVGDDEQQR